MIYLPVIIGFTILFAFSAAEKIGVTLSLIVAAACFVISIILLIFKRFRKSPVYSVVLISAAVALLYSTLYPQIAHINNETSLNEFCTIEGKISEFPEEKNEKYYYILEDIKLNELKSGGKARISSQKKIDARMGDVIKVSCTLFEPKNADYYRAKDIFLSAYVTDFENVGIIKDEKKSLSYYPEYLCDRIKESLKAYIPKDEAGFLCGLITGDKSGISNALYIDFRRIGLAHWLAVSGLHLSILSAVLSFIFRKTNRWIKAGIISVCLIFFAAITGFEGSVLRSLVMHLLVIFAQLVYRKADSLNSLGIAVMLICLHSPYAVHDLGFILSVFSTLGIILLGSRINYAISKRIKISKKKIIRKIIDSAIGTFSCSVSSTVFLLPFSIYYFGTVSVFSPIVNLIFMFPFTVLFVLAGIIAALFYIPGLDLLVRVISFITAIITRIMLYVVSWISDIPYMSISVYTDLFKIWFIITCVIIAAAIIINKRKVTAFFTVLSALIFVIAVTVNQISLRNSVQVTITDCGNDLSVIVTDSENTLVIGTDGYYTDESLSVMCISKVDGAMILNSKYDDFSGAMTLCKEFDTKKLYYADTYIDASIEKKAKIYKAEENIYKVDKFSAEFFEHESGEYAILNVGDVSFLICSDKIKLSEISGNFDYVVTSKMPGNIENMSCETLVISAYEDNVEKIAKRFDDIANKYIATSGKGDIIIKITDDKESIRRGYNG